MYKIVIDSCGELPEELKQDGHYETVSLELEVDGCRIKDDSTFNQLDFLRRVKESLKGPKSSCPSPEQYMDAYEGEADHVYVVTLSGGLSGSYNSAVLGKNLYEEEHTDAKKIYVFFIIFSLSQIIKCKSYFNRAYTLLFFPKVSDFIS